MFNFVQTVMNNIKTLDRQRMKFTHAVRFRESGKVLICTFTPDVTCTATEFDRRGVRSELYRGWDIGLNPTATLTPNGSQFWFSGGIIYSNYRESYIDESGSDVTLSKAIFTFTDTNGMIRKRRLEHDMPEERIMHCFIPICNDAMFMFGGYDHADCFPGTHAYTELRQACQTRQLLHSNVSRTAFILRHGIWKRVPELSPCRYTNYSNTHTTACAMRYSEGNQCEVVIPTYDFVAKKRCTAVLNLQTLKWNKLENDDTRKALYGGYAISVGNYSRVLYLGGFDDGNEKLDSIYELTNNNIWQLWDHAKLPHKGAATFLHLDFFSMQLDHCRSNKSMTTIQ